VGGLLTNLAISVFLLPTLYAVLAGPGDIATPELPHDREASAPLRRLAS
jgi:hypothetical protein